MHPRFHAVDFPALPGLSSLFILQSDRTTCGLKLQQIAEFTAFM